jgi:hypothetical protein
VISSSDVIFELQKYVAFFEENFVPITATKYRRSWRFISDYNSPTILDDKPVFIIEPQFDNGLPECYLFDYSNIIKVGVTEENYNDFLNQIHLERLDIRNLTKSKMQEILKNNALAANEVRKIQKQIEMRKNIDSMF